MFHAPMGRSQLDQDFELPLPQSGLNPRTLDLDASKLPRDHRGQSSEAYFIFPEFSTNTAS